MSNVIDINDRLTRRQRDKDISGIAQLAREIIEKHMADSEWPRLFAGATTTAAIVNWIDREWATFRLATHTLEKSSDNPLFGSVFSFNTAYREQYVPEFGNQSIVKFLSVQCIVREGVIKGIGCDDSAKEKLMQALLAYANSFSQFPNTKFAFQLGFLGNVLYKNTIFCPNIKDVDGKWVLEVLIPADNPEAGLYLEVSMTFDFLPVLLDYMASEYVLQLPEDQV